MGKRGPTSRAERSMIQPHRPVIVPDLPTTDEPPPSHLSEASQAWWRAVTSDFRFEKHQLRTLQVALEAFDRGQRARAELAAHGALTFTDAKGMVRAMPQVAIERDAGVAYLRALRELGLDDVEAPSDNSFRPFGDRGYGR